MEHKSHYGTQYKKMIEMPVSKLILLLAFPSTVSILITHLYNLVDTYFVGKLGTSASGSVGIVFGIMALLQAFGFMYGQGAGNIISRLLGANKEKEADVVASVAIFSAFLTGIIIAIFGLVFIKPILFLLGATDTIFPFGKDYAIWIFIAAPFIMCSLVINNLFRYQGKANIGVIGIITGALLNMILDPILMFRFDLDIMGAGISTAISQFIGFAVLAFLFQSKHSQQTFRFKHISSFSKEIKKITITGLPALFRQGASSISTMLLNREARIYGDSAVAAMSIVGRISFFIFAVGLGVAQGYQPTAGFNYGAKKYERVRAGFLFTLSAGELILGIFAVLGMIMSDNIVGVFQDDVEVIQIGSSALLMQCIGTFFIPLTVCTNVLFQSVEKNVEASIVSIMRSGLFFIPLILILPKRLGLLGVEIAQPIADFLAFSFTLPLSIKLYLTVSKEKE